MNEKLFEVLDRNIQRSLASAEDDGQLDLAMEPPVEDAIMDHPPISVISRGLESGFTVEEEAWARRSPDFQRMVRLYWHVSPVSFWILARYRVEGDQFAFAPALRQLLEEPDGENARVALNSPVTRMIETAYRKIAAVRETWQSLQRRILDWEAGAHCFLVTLPATEGALADQDAEPFSEAEEFENGLSVRLEEVRRSDLMVDATLPAADAGEGTLHVALLGETGNQVSAEVKLEAAGDFAGGKIRVGDFAETRERLGEHCLVVVSTEPLPNLED